MTSQNDDGPFGDLAAEGGGAEHDPEVAEAYAEDVGVDPTPEEIARYQELTGDPEAPASSADDAAVDDL